MNECKKFLDAEIAKAIPRLRQRFRTPHQLSLAATELATSLRIIFGNIVEVIRTIKDDYGALHVILLQQTVNFKKSMDFYLPMVNRLIAFAAATQGATVCPPLMSSVKSDYCNDKVHHSTDGVMRLFAVHHKMNNYLRKLLVNQDITATALTDVLLEVVERKTPPPPSSRFGERIPKIEDFFYENYLLSPAKKYVCIKTKNTQEPYRFSERDFPWLSVTITDSMYRAAVAKLPTRRRFNRHGSAVAISPGASYAHWAQNLKEYAPIRQCQNKAAIFYVALGTNDAFFLEKRLKTLFKRLNPRQQRGGRRNTQQRC